MCLVSIEPEQNAECDSIKITICFYLKYSIKCGVNAKLNFLLTFSILEIGVLLKNSCNKLFGNLIFVNLIIFATFHTQVVLAYFQPFTNDTQKNFQKHRFFFFYFSDFPFLCDFLQLFCVSFVNGWKYAHTTSVWNVANIMSLTKIKFPNNCLQLFFNRMPISKIENFNKKSIFVFTSHLLEYFQ